VSQNAQGHVLGHVKNLGLNYADPTTRGYQTAARLPFHTDYSDLVALLCLRNAREGGLSMVASSSRIYREMRARRPDLAAVLTRPVCRSRWGEVSTGQKPWLEVPVFNLYPGGVSTTYVRSAIDKAQRLPSVPALSSEQIEAMDMLDALAADPEFHHDMAFAPGDVQIVNNHCVLHSRTAYVDHDEVDARRHLLRLWLACADGPPFPQAMTEGFQGLSANGRPNGIHIAGVAPIAPLEAS
jgi:alpha-ketoglutarate-dependent taurine dioxygenase